jgi:malto-oligosyltrehalose trehalohydrolase
MKAHGPECLPDGFVRFRLWAPACERIQLELLNQSTTFHMPPCGGGWHEVVCKAAAGDRYRFVLPDGRKVADPASNFQSEDVHGPSELIDFRMWPWESTGRGVEMWKGRPWNEAVIYELHVGAFTPEGTFRAAIEKLDYLASLGVTALELMPVADFPGSRNWGYDGVFLYAPDSSYGRPEDLKALVDASHARGLMIFLDVVYNHLGPEGNYLPLYAPQFFTDRHKTPWGSAINYDGPESQAVREFVIQNALHWITQFHFDGLRLDAVHAIVDDSPVHILEELAQRVRAEAGDRHIHLILENEENQACWLDHRYTAQWNDDVHHVLHCAITSEKSGYYADYLDDTAQLGRALAEGFAFQGETMAYRGRARGEPSAHLSPQAFIAFLQNHDQVGNRAFGERIGMLASRKSVRAASAVYLLLPQIPMIFMGEEWFAGSPFPFFCDFGPDLAAAVRKGRREEFSRFPQFQDPEQRESIPDPQAEETFLSAKLNWDESTQPLHEEWLDWYRRILAARKQFIEPLRESIQHGGTFQVLAPRCVSVQWPSGSGTLKVQANLSDAPVAAAPILSSVFWKEGAIDDGGRLLQPWTVVWWTD